MRRRCQAHRVPCTCSPAPTIWAHASNRLRLRGCERSSAPHDLTTGVPDSPFPRGFFFKKNVRHFLVVEPALELS
jgi:hypothetical protein